MYQIYVILSFLSMIVAVRQTVDVCNLEHEVVKYIRGLNPDVAYSPFLVTYAFAGAPVGGTLGTIHVPVRAALLSEPCCPECLEDLKVSVEVKLESIKIKLLSIAAVSHAFPNSNCESTKRLTDLVTQRLSSLTKTHHSCEFGFAASFLLEKLKKAKVKRRLPSLIRVLDWKGRTVLLTTYKKCKNDKDCVRRLLGKGKERDRVMKSIKRQLMGANSIGCDLWKQKRRTNLFCIFSPKMVEYDDHYMYYDYSHNTSDYSYPVEDPYADFATYE